MGQVGDGKSKQILRSFADVDKVAIENWPRPDQPPCMLSSTISRTNGPPTWSIAWSFGESFLETLQTGSDRNTSAIRGDLGC